MFFFNLLSIQDKCYICRAPNCTFKSCDSGSLLRHRIDIHKYIPKKTAVRYKVEKPKKHVPVCVVRGFEADSGSASASELSQFFTVFSSVPEASTSRSSFSSRLGPSLLPPEYFSPPLPLSSSLSPSYSGSHRINSFSPTNYSGENEISPCTPITSTFHHESTPEGPSPAVLSMLSYPVYENTNLSYHHHDHDSDSDSLLFAPPTTVKDYTWDRPLTSADGYSMVAPRESESEVLEYQHPAEEVYRDTSSTISEDGELKLNLPPCTYP
jgi:hypothetical protein